LFEDFLPSTSPKPEASNSSWIAWALLKLKVLMSSQIKPAKKKKTENRLGYVEYNFKKRRGAH